jgi:hypothetical protein
MFHSGKTEAALPFLWEHQNSTESSAAKLRLFGQDDQSTSSLEMSTGASAWQRAPIATSSTTMNELPGLSLGSSPHSRFGVPLSGRTALAPRTTNYRKHRSPQNGTSVIDSSVKKRKSKAQEFQLRKAIAHLENILRSYPTSLPHFKPKFGILLSQLKLLLEEEELNGIMETDILSLQSGYSNAAPSDTNFTAESIFSQDSLSTSGIIDSDYRTEDGTSVSSTPRQTVYVAQETTSMDLDTAQPPDRVKAIYECTKEMCNYSTHSEVDWKRHETGDKHWPQERFMCLQCPDSVSDPDGYPICVFCFIPFFMLGDVQAHYLQCESARTQGKTFGRKDHFCKHLRDEHHIDNVSQQAANWKYSVNSDWPRECGFCGIFFQSWEQRMQHIALHYQNGSKVKDWKLPYSRPQDSGYRRAGMDPRRDESDDGDDFDDNNSKPHGGASGRRKPPTAFLGGQVRIGQSNVSHGNASRPQEASRRRRPHSFHAYVLHYNAARNNFRRTTGYMSLALERYLNDTEERVPRLWDPDPENYNAMLHRFDEARPSEAQAGTNIEGRTWPGTSEKSTNPHAIVLHGLPGGRKTHLAQQYISKLEADLPGGVIWMNSDLDPGVEAGFWDIALQSLLEQSVSDPMVTQFLQDWLCDGHQNLRGRSRSLGEFPLASDRRRAWSQSEDASLLHLISKQGAIGQGGILQLLGFWSPRQCRERYQNLRPLLMIQSRRSSLDPDRYHISESMELVHASSRKRTNPPNVPQSGGIRDCRSRDDYSPEYLLRGPKSQRRHEPSLGAPTSHSNALSISTNSSFVVLEGNFSSIQTQNESDIDVLQDEFFIFPPDIPLGFPQYPTVDDQLSPQQDVAITNGTPATYTITNSTFSPRSLNRQSLLDPNDYANQSPDGGSERLFAGSDDFNFGLGDEWQPNEPRRNHLMLGNSGKSIS